MTSAMIARSEAPTICIPVVTQRLPTRRLASALNRSSVPHDEGGTESGQEADGHRRSLGKGPPRPDRVPRVGTSRAAGMAGVACYTPTPVGM